jgi:hypothetical protein
VVPRIYIIHNFIILQESRVKGKKASETSKRVDESEAKVVPTSYPKPPLITKWKVGVKLQGRSESDGESNNNET